MWKSISWHWRLVESFFLTGHDIDLRDFARILWIHLRGKWSICNKISRIFTFQWWKTKQRKLSKKMFRFCWIEGICECNRQQTEDCNCCCCMSEWLHNLQSCSKEFSIASSSSFYFLISSSLVPIGFVEFFVFFSVGTADPSCARCGDVQHKSLESSIRVAWNFNFLLRPTFFSFVFMNQQKKKKIFINTWQILGMERRHIEWMESANLRGGKKSRENFTQMKATDI